MKNSVSKQRLLDFWQNSKLRAQVLPEPGDTVFALDGRGQILEWNDDAARVFGYSREAALAMSFDALCPDDRTQPDRARFDLRQVMSGRDYAGGFQCPAAGGRTIAIYMYATAGLDRSGQVAGVVCLAREVTDFWRAEQVAAASQEKYQALFAAASDVVLILRGDGRVVDANPAAFQLLGIPVVDLSGRSLLQLVSVEQRSQLEAALTSVLRRGPVGARQIELCSGFGRAKKVEFNFSPVQFWDEELIMAVGRDVTERSRVQDALRESEERYRGIFAAARDAVFLETLDGEMLEVNEGACELLGYDRGSLLRKTVDDIVPAETKAWLPNVRQALLQTGRFRGEATNVRRDGTEVQVEISCSLVDIGGRKLVVALTRDISGRKRAELALRESEQKHRELVERASDGICIVQDGRLKYANPRLAEIQGTGVEQAIGRPFTEFIHPDELVRVSDIYRRRMAGEKVASIYEAALLHRDGHRIETEFNAGIISYEGRPADLVLVRDITERKKAEVELRESRRALVTLMGNLPGMAYRCKNDPDWTIEFVSDGCLALTGYQPEDLVGNRRVAYGQLIHPNDRLLVWDEVQAALRAGEPFDLTYRIIDASGGEKWVLERGLGVHDEDGKLVALEGFVSDITVLRRTEGELRQSRERYRSLFFGAPIGIYRTTPEGRILMANPALVEMLGYTSFWDLAGRNLETEGFHAGYERAQFKRRLEAEGEVTGLEAVWRRKDGSMLSVRENARLVRGPDGTPVYYEGTVEDVTEKRRLAQEVEELAAGLRAIVENVPYGVAAELDGRIHYANSEFARIFGYETPAELEGRPVVEMVAEDDRERVAGYARARHSGAEAPTSYTFTGLRRDGSRFRVENTVTLYRLRGRTYILGTVKPASAGSC